MMRTGLGSDPRLPAGLRGLSSSWASSPCSWLGVPPRRACPVGGRKGRPPGHLPLGGPADDARGDRRPRHRGRPRRPRRAMTLSVLMVVGGIALYAIGLAFVEQLGTRLYQAGGLLTAWSASSPSIRVMAWIAPRNRAGRAGQKASSGSSEIVPPEPPGGGYFPVIVTVRDLITFLELFHCRWHVGPSLDPRYPRRTSRYSIILGNRANILSGSASEGVQDDGPGPEASPESSRPRHPLHRGRPCSPVVRVPSWVVPKRSHPPSGRRICACSIPCGRDARPRTSSRGVLRLGVTQDTGPFRWNGGMGR